MAYKEPVAYPVILVYRWLNGLIAYQLDGLMAHQMARLNGLWAIEGLMGLWAYGIVGLYID